MMLMLMLILILTADVDAGFYDFGIKGVGWSAFSGLRIGTFRFVAFMLDDRIELGVLDSFYLSRRRRASIGCICMSVERSLGVWHQKTDGMYA